MKQLHSTTQTHQGELRAAQAPRRAQFGVPGRPRAYRLLAACLLWASLPAAQAATTTWIAANGGNWEDAANWSAGVPQVLDVALVTPATRPDFNVVINAATTIAGLALANANLRVAAPLTVTGSMSWDESGERAGGLTFSNSATLRLLGPVSVTGNAAKGLNLTGVLDLAGTSTWTGNTSAGGNSLTVGINSANTVVRNRGVFVDSNAFDTTIAGRGTFDNQGNFTKTSASVTRMDVADFRNSGSVAITAGTLVLPTMSGVQVGNWQVDAGAVLDFSGGTPTLLGTLGGGGTLRISGGTVGVEGFGRNLPMVLDGGTLAGSHQVFDGPFTWRTGALAGDGTTIITGALTLEGSAPKIIGSGRAVTAYGQTNWSGGNLAVGQEGLAQTAFINSGEFRDIDGGGRSIVGLDPTRSAWVNVGSYVKTGAGVTLVSSLGFDNQGSLDVRAGVMRFTQPLTNSGLIQVAGGAGVLVAPIFVPLQNTGTLAGDGAIDTSIGFINRGLISPGSGIGTLSMGNLTLAPEGALKIELGGAGLHDLLRLTGVLTLGGTLDLWNAGYLPQLGDSFEVLQYASRTGFSIFDAVRLNGFGQEVAFDVLYGADNVRLVVTAVPEPGTAALWLAGLAVIGALARRRSQVRSAGPA